MTSVRSRRLLPAVMMVVGLAIFLGLAAGCKFLYDQTENRLLQQRTNEASAALQLSVTQLTAPLDAAAKLAAATNGDAASFAKIVEPYLGTDAGKFASAALYRIGSTTPTTSVGAPIVLPTDGPNSAHSMLANGTTNPFAIVNLLGDEGRHLGYAVADTAKNPQWVAYGERTLSADPNIRRRTDEPFAQLNYAIYLGDQPATDHLLGASAHNLPFTGRTAHQVVAFGDTNLLLVMTPIGHLSGGLFANLWWIVACGGVLLSAAFALLTRRLLDRRDTA
ncbi:MAG: hypothetical protein JJD93_19245, partial [Ilumatobacteraceae bacterium]|nr:hypothetical protein [Ilumatobacteraceae bacterium]